MIYLMVRFIRVGVGCVIFSFRSARCLFLFAKSRRNVEDFNLICCVNVYLYMCWLLLLFLFG